MDRVRIVLSTIGALAAEPLTPEPSPFGATATYEKEVMSFFIDHHTVAIELAKIGAEKAFHVDLKALCEEMARRLLEERDSLHAWFERWYAQEHEPDVTDDEVLVLESLASLSGDAFEVAFMKDLIRHQGLGVAKGTKKTRRLYHGELKRLSRNAIRVWLRESSILRQWLSRWYGVGE